MIFPQSILSYSPLSPITHPPPPFSHPPKQFQIKIVRNQDLAPPKFHIQTPQQIFPQITIFVNQPPPLLYIYQIIDNPKSSLIISQYQSVGSSFYAIISSVIFSMQEESIYNLVPKEYVPPPKQAKHKSKYPPNLPPTGSTFCHKTTSKPGVSNLSGKLAEDPGAHTNYGETKTMGHLKGERKPSPDKFRLKNTGTMGSNKLPDAQRYEYECAHKKDPVPLVGQKPVMGLKSGKNFVVTNAVENILSVPKVAKEDVKYVNKKDYGKVPQYLDKIKSSIEQEYQMIQHIRSDAPETFYSLSQDEAEELKNGLKRKWEEINKEYQSITHISKIDTIGLKRKKENCEKQLAEIERDIKKLNKMYVFVDTR